MSPVEMRARSAIADKPVSKEIKSLLADEATPAVAVMLNAVESVGMGEAVGIEAAGKRGSEEFQ
jgi:hypothetical protein